MNGAAAKILVVDDEAIARANLARVLAHDGHETAQAGSGSIALEMLQHGEYDLVLTDLIMPDMGGLELLERVRARFPGTEVIVVTGYPMVETAVEAMRKGAYHYLAKPYQLDEARLLVARALEKRRLYLEVARMRSLLETREGPLLLGDAPVMRELKRTIARVAPSDASVLILGDTGTGKELAARSIHALSRRAGGRFLAVNCGALQEELLESELFGHEQGAFSGAVRRKPGLFEAACGGTLFLDELGEMSPAMQVKLLRALQERVIRRVGGTRDIEVDVRVLAATNRNLRLEVSRGNFREDLYYRLAVITLRMPALAERREDIPLLAHFFLETGARRSRRRTRKKTRKEPASLDRLMMPMDQGVAKPRNSRKTRLSKGAPSRLEIRMRWEKGLCVKVNRAQSPSSPTAKATALATASWGVAIYQLTTQPASMAQRIWCPTRRWAKSRTTKTKPTISDAGGQRSPLGS